MKTLAYIYILTTWVFVPIANYEPEKPTPKPPAIERVCEDCGWRNYECWELDEQGKLIEQ